MGRTEHVTTARLQRVASVLLRLEPGEGLRVGLMLLYSVAVVGGVVITGQLVSRSLFLSRLPATDIPYKFILPPLALMVATGIYARLSPRFRRDRLIVVTCAIMIAAVAGFRLLLSSGLRQEFGTLCALFIVFDVIGDLAILQFWTFAGDLFNAREARRLFGLIGGGSAVSNVAFGLLLSSTADLVRPENLTFAMMASLAVCGACAGILGHRHHRNLAEVASETLPATDDGDEDGLLSALSEVFRLPLLLSMSGIVILVAVVSNIADYQLDLALQSRYGDSGQAMVAFLGQFRCGAGLAAIALQFFLAGRLMERFGVATVLLLLPLSVAMGSGAVLLTGGVLWAAAIPRACDVVLKYSVNDAALNLLYLPVGPRLRARAKAILDGMVRPPVVSLLGVIFLVAGPSFSLVQWSIPVLALIGVWVLLVRRSSRQYVQALGQSIQYRRLDLERATVDLADESSLRVIRAALEAEDDLRVVHALSLLPRIPTIDWTPQVAGLVNHTHAGVRTLAVEYLGRGGDPSHAELVRPALSDRDEEVRSAAVLSLCAVDGHLAIPTVSPLLADASARVRGAASMGLIRYAGLDGVLQGGERLREMLSDDEPTGRIEGLRALAALQMPTFYHPLIGLLGDSDLRVQLSAIRAASRIGSADFLPQLVQALRSPATRAAAADAIYQSLDGDVAPLLGWLSDPQQPVSVRVQLILVLGLVRGPASTQHVIDQLNAPEDELRGAAYTALLSLRGDDSLDLSMDGDRWRDAIGVELRRAREFHLAIRSLQAEGVGLLLEDALATRREAAGNRLLSLLDLVYPQISARWVRESLGSADPRRRASAIELLDNVLDRDLRHDLLPLLTIAPRRPGVAAMSALSEDLEPSQPDQPYLPALCRDPDPWVRACALFDVGFRGLADRAPQVEDNLGSADDVVRETALWAHRRVTPDRGDTPMALSTLEKVFFLKSVPLFGHIAGEEIVDIVPILREMLIAAGETFIRKGDEGDCLYILVEGEVGVTGRSGRYEVMKSREVIGELAALTEQPRTADCIALTDLVVLRVDKRDLWELMDRQPRLTIEIMKVLVGRYVSSRPSE